MTKFILFWLEVGMLFSQHDMIVPKTSPIFDGKGKINCTYASKSVEPYSYLHKVDWREELRRRDDGLGLGGFQLYGAIGHISDDRRMDLGVMELDGGMKLEWDIGE